MSASSQSTAGCRGVSCAAISHGMRWPKSTKWAEAVLAHRSGAGSLRAGAPPGRSSRRPRATRMNENADGDSKQPPLPTPKVKKESGGHPQTPSKGSAPLHFQFFHHPLALVTSLAAPLNAVPATGLPGSHTSPCSQGNDPGEGQSLAEAGGCPGPPAPAQQPDRSPRRGYRRPA